MIYKNEYASLKHSGLVQGIPSNPQTQSIYNCGRESITLTTAEVKKNQWAYGYVINFADGRRAEKAVGDIEGWFVSRRDAKLYFLGYVMQYRKFFSDDCIKAVKFKILELIENNLFG